MHSTFILGFLLVCTACACHCKRSYSQAQGRNFHELGTLDMEDDSEAMTVEHLPGTCYICKRILEGVKKTIPDEASKNQIIQKLHDICNNLGPIKRPCKKLINNNLNKMVDELFTNDGPRQACVNMKLCKPKVFMELF